MSSPSGDIEPGREQFPVQRTPAIHRDQSKVPRGVIESAYEVYCHVYAPQKRLVTGNCRGGFSAGELIAFLYARRFDRSEWGQRVDEVFKGMEHL